MLKRMVVLACFALCAMGLMAGTAWAGPEDGNAYTPYGVDESRSYDDGYGDGYGYDHGYRGYDDGYDRGYGGCNPNPDGVAGNDCGYEGHDGYGGGYGYETPRGGVNTGAGGTAPSGPDTMLVAFGAMMLLAAAGIGGVTLRRRRDSGA